ncbi:MAG: hypothetical protein ACREJB_19420 [Planctomycetaceae bacterium]
MHEDSWTQSVAVRTSSMPMFHQAIGGPTGSAGTEAAETRIDRAQSSETPGPPKRLLPQAEPDGKAVGLERDADRKSSGILHEAHGTPLGSAWGKRRRQWQITVEEAGWRDRLEDGVRRILSRPKTVAGTLIGAALLIAVGIDLAAMRGDTASDEPALPTSAALVAPRPAETPAIEAEPPASGAAQQFFSLEEFPPPDGPAAKPPSSPTLTPPTANQGPVLSAPPAAAAPADRSAAWLTGTIEDWNDSGLQRLAAPQQDRRTLRR